MFLRIQDSGFSCQLSAISSLGASFGLPAVGKEISFQLSAISFFSGSFGLSAVSKKLAFSFQRM